jgi:hypothetical protein
MTVRNGIDHLRFKGDVEVFPHFSMLGWSNLYNTDKNDFVLLKLALT